LLHTTTILPPPPLSLPDALPIYHLPPTVRGLPSCSVYLERPLGAAAYFCVTRPGHMSPSRDRPQPNIDEDSSKVKSLRIWKETLDRKSTRLNSSHVKISYAAFCF